MTPPRLPAIRAAIAVAFAFAVPRLAVAEPVTVSPRLIVAHVADSPVVTDAASRGTWTYDYALQLAVLRADQPAARVTTRVDADVLFLTAPPESYGVLRRGGGFVDAQSVGMLARVREASAALSLGPLGTVTVGRILTPASERVLSAVRVLEPEGPAAPVGFDGAAISVPIGRALVARGDVAIQDAVWSGEARYVRVRGAVATALPFVRAEASIAWEWATLLRPGLSADVSLGPVALRTEAAVELYDARAGLIRLQPLVLAGLTWGDPTNRYDERSGAAGGDTPLISLEYLFNGLAESHPANAGTPLGPLTSDGAAGFERSGRHYLAASGTIPVAGVTLGGSVIATVPPVGDRAAVSALSRLWVDALAAERVRARLAVEWRVGAVGSEFAATFEDLLVDASIAIPVRPSR